jgi:hypothetical protein
MNERIQQLWRQVELQECDCGCNPDEFLRLKFAELIVRECAEIARVWSVEGVEYDGGDAIREHFGVER